MIKLENLTKIYNSNGSSAIGLQNINLELHCGEFVAVVGASGSGKTTLLNVISGMDTYNEGELIIDGKSTSGFSITDFENFRQNNVAFIFQNYQLIDSYTALENVMTELLIRGYKRKEAKQKAKEYLSQVGLMHRMNHRATKLSGGEKQRVVIARALASDAKILACDEPTGNLDSKNATEIIQLIHSVAKDKLVLLVTHDESLINSVATRIIRIRDGKIESDIQQQPVENSLNGDLVFSKHKISNFTKFYVTLKNTFRTPKTTFFMLILFLFLTFVIFFSIAYIPLDVVATEDTEIEYTLFENRDKNRIITYMNNDFTGTLQIDENMIYTKDYLLDVSFHSASLSSTLNKYIKDKSYLRLSKEGIVLLVGDFPKKEDEVLLIIGKNFSEDYLRKELNRQIRFSISNQYFSDYYKITGFAYEENALENYTNIYMNHEGAVSFLNALDKKYTSLKFCSAFEKDFSIHEGKDRKGVYVNQKNNSTENNIIRINYKYEDKDYAIFLGNYKLDLSKYKIKYVYDLVNNYDAEISASLANEIVASTPYRMSIYTDAENEKSVVSSLRKNSTLEIFPMNESIRYIPRYDIIGIATNLFYVVFLFIEIVVSILISSLISAFILNSKKKELSILRVLGLSKMDIFLTIIFELLMIMLLAISMNLAISGILLLFIKNHTYSIIFNSPSKLVLSIAILILMSIIIALRWTNKLFKSTAREGLKVGDIE
ncbi:MAG: ATP-binding cassette domain-containing protein [Roseburia sp.]|nr:ATP-binding cassette domain-containing protein [Anaeroplasma bactoclasticum]MCM1195469.1 ATP-binding cassette domain-containing protein [Roseburia sp.]MCM1555947.1 ATP-binding cassette domain-containing protein [Anaeroplasma bactoclasticum]